MPAEKCPTKLEVRRGDTTIFTYASKRVTDATTNPVTTTPLILTSATIKFTAKNDPDDSDADAVFQKTTSGGITITSGPLGQFQVKLAPADTSSIDLACEDFLDLYFDCQVTLGATNGPYSSGDVITVDSGILTVFVDRTIA